MHDIDFSDFWNKLWFESDLGDYLAASNITHANMEAVFTLTDMPFKSAWFIGFDNE